jgi:hypothetical protein
MLPFRANARTYFVHAAHRSVGVSSATAALAACDPGRFGTAESDAPDAGQLAVAFLASSEADGAARTLASLSRYIGLRLGARCVWLDNEPIAADVAVLLADAGALDERLIGHLPRHCVEGGGVVALGVTATPCRAERAFQWDVLGAALGEPQHVSGGRVELARSAADNPILRNLELSVVRAAPSASVSCLADDAEALLVARHGECTEPVAWVRRYGLGRVFSTTLKPAKDLRLEDLLRLVEPAVLWAAGREPPPD